MNITQFLSDYTTTTQQEFEGVEMLPQDVLENGV